MARKKKPQRGKGKPTKPIPASPPSSPTSPSPTRPSPAHRTGKPPGPNGIEKRKGISEEERRYKVARLYIEGKPQYLIAMELGISQPVVCQDLRAIREYWKASAIVDYDERKTLELAKIDHVEEVAWEAWFRSCEDAEFVRRRVEEGVKIDYGRGREATTDNKPGMGGSRTAANRGRNTRANSGKQATAKGAASGMDPVRAVNASSSTLVPIRRVEEVTRQGRTGDPRFLDQIQRCIEMRLRLLGLLRPDTQKNINQVFVNWDQLAAAPTPVLAGSTNSGLVLDHVEARLREEEEDGGNGREGADSNGYSHGNGTTNGHIPEEE